MFLPRVKFSPRFRDFPEPAGWRAHLHIVECVEISKIPMISEVFNIGENHREEGEYLEILVFFRIFQDCRDFQDFQKL